MNDSLAHGHGIVHDRDDGLDFILRHRPPERTRQKPRENFAGVADVLAIISGKEEGLVARGRPFLFDRTFDFD